MFSRYTDLPPDPFFERLAFLNWLASGYYDSPHLRRPPSSFWPLGFDVTSDPFVAIDPRAVDVIYLAAEVYARASPYQETEEQEAIANAIVDRMIEAGHVSVRRFLQCRPRDPVEPLPYPKREGFLELMARKVQDQPVFFSRISEVDVRKCLSAAIDALTVGARGSRQPMDAPGMGGQQQEPTPASAGAGMAPEDPIGPGYYQASVNSRMIGFSLRHPIAASAIGTPSRGSTNISTNAVRFSTRIGLDENAQHEGSQVNAFRHTLWQADITKEYGANIAKQVGNAHEDNPFAATGSNLKTSFSTLSKADETIDLFNNAIGRSIGEANPKANMQELALKTLDYYKDNGLWTASPVTNDKGKTTGYKISQTKLGQEQYNAAKSIIQELNGNGFNQQEQRQQAADAQKIIDQLNRGPKF